MTKRIYFVAHGTVQQVGFRYHTREKARQYGVTGWCRNTPDDKVEGEAQGSESVLEQFMNDVNVGPRYAKVTELTKEERDVVDGEASFDIRR